MQIWFHEYKHDLLRKMKHLHMRGDDELCAFLGFYHGSELFVLFFNNLYLTAKINAFLWNVRVIDRSIERRLFNRYEADKQLWIPTLGYAKSWFELWQSDQQSYTKAWILSEQFILLTWLLTVILYYLFLVNSTRFKLSSHRTNLKIPVFSYL